MVNVSTMNYKCFFLAPTVRTTLAQSARAGTKNATKHKSGNAAK